MSIHLSANKHPRTGGVYSYSFYVPKNVGAAAQEDAAFEAELHPDGILFRFVGIEPRKKNGRQRGTEKPAWAREEQA